MKDFEKEFDEKFFEALHDGKDHHQWLPVELKGFIIGKIWEAKAEEKKQITEIVNNMPDCFPERESDEYERAYRDAKGYILNKIKK